MVDGARTRDNRNHKPGLYQLSYCHHYLVAAFGEAGARKLKELVVFDKKKLRFSVKINRRFHKMLNIRFYFRKRKGSSVFIIPCTFGESEDSLLVLRVGGKKCGAERLAAGGVSGDEGNMSASFD